MKIGDLTYSLGAEWDKDSLDSIKDGFTNVSKSFMTAVGIASTALAGTFAVVKEFAGANDELGKLARNKDIAVDSLQAMQYSFEGAGIAGSKVGDVLDKLQEQKEGFRKGTADYEAFAQIGVNPRAYKNNEDYFNAVLDGLGKVKDEATKSDLAKRLLGSADMKNLIDGGSEAIRQQKKELEEMGILLSQQDYKESANFNDTLLKTTTILKGLANKVMTSLMPLFTNLMKKFNEFMKANRELLSSGLKTFLSAIIDGSQFFLSLIGRIIEHLGGVKVVISIIAGLLLLWQFPLIATIALITAVFLAFDDIMNFIKGNDSVIGGWLNNIVQGFEEFKANFPNIGAMFQMQFDVVKTVFIVFKDTLLNIWELLTGQISFSEFILNQILIIRDLLNNIKVIFLNFVDWISSIFDNLTIFDGFKNKFEDIKNYVVNMFTSIKEIFNDFKSWISSIFDNLTIFGGVKKQLDSIKDTVSSLVPDVSSITDKISNILPDKVSSFMGFGGDEKAQVSTNPTMVDSSSTSSSTTSNIYHISANVDAKSKSISEAITEISNPSGY